MSEVHVVTAELLTGAAGLQHVAQGVAATHAEDELERLTTALEGTRSAQSARHLAGEWGNWIRSWEQATSNHQDALVSSAEDYSDVDETTADTQREILSRIVSAAPGISAGRAGVG